MCSLSRVQLPKTLSDKKIYIANVLRNLNLFRSLLVAAHSAQMKEKRKKNASDASDA